MRLQVTLQKHEFKRKFLTEGRQFHLHVSCGSRHSLWYISKCNLSIILTQFSVTQLIMSGTTKLLHAPVMRWLALQSNPLPGDKSWRVPWRCFDVINHWLDYWSPILLYKVRMACEAHISYYAFESLVSTISDCLTGIFKQLSPLHFWKYAICPGFGIKVGDSEKIGRLKSTCLYGLCTNVLDHVYSTCSQYLHNLSQKQNASHRVL